MSAGHVPGLIFVDWTCERPQLQAVLIDRPWVVVHRRRWSAFAPPGWTVGHMPGNLLLQVLSASSLPVHTCLRRSSARRLHALLLSVCHGSGPSRGGPPMSAMLPATAWRPLSRGAQGNLDVQPPLQVMRISPCAVSWLESSRRRWVLGAWSEHAHRDLSSCLWPPQEWLCSVAGKQMTVGAEKAGHRWQFK